MSQDIGGAELEYLYYPGSGRAVILLHATGFQPWLWHPIARDLADEYAVIAPYFCEHRVFDPKDGGLSWAVLARDLSVFINRLGIEKPMMVGHSMGATVSIIAEALAGPVASRMVLVEPILLPAEFYELDVDLERHPLASKAIRRRSVWDGETEARDYLDSKRLFKNWDEEMLDLYLEHGMTRSEDGRLTLACHPEREAALFMGGAEIDPWPLLEKIRCPVLLVEGERSENRSVIDLERAASMLPAGELRIIPEAGHLVPMEKPREFLALILEFLRNRAPEAR